MKGFMIISLFLFLLSNLALGNEQDLVPRLDLSSNHPVAISQAATFEEPASKTGNFSKIIDLDRKGLLKWSFTDKMSLGYRETRTWVKFKLSNSSSNNDWALEHRYPLIQNLEIIIHTEKSGDFKLIGGRLIPFNERAIKYKNFILPFTLEKGDVATVYASLASQGSIHALFRVLSKNSMISDVGFESTWLLGCYYGVMLAMILYNLFLFTTFDKMYLLYVAYTVTFALFQMSLHGTSYQYLWPNSVKFNNISVPFFTGISYLFLSLFVRQFLESRKYSKTSDALLLFCALGSVFLTGCSIFHYEMWVNQFNSFACFIASFILLAACLFAWRGGSKNVIYFIIAFFVFFILSSATSATYLGWIQSNFISLYGMEVGSAVEAILLSLALASRIRALQDSEVLSEFGSQLAHDIMGFLPAITEATKLIRNDNHFLKNPEPVINLIDTGASEISDYCIQMQDKKSQFNNKRFKTGLKTETYFSSSLLDQVASSKRIQFKSKSDFIKIILKSSHESAFKMIHVNSLEFKTAISNLVINAVQSIELSARKKGTVTICLESDHNHIRVSVEDDGCGISKEKANEILTKKKIKSTKTKGSGLESVLKGHELLIGARRFSII